MNRPIFTLFLVLLFSAVRGQQERLPADLRQHNLTTYNASLFNPAFSVGRNNPESVAFWARWQWQGIDADPSTLFLNYTRTLNDKSAAGAGFFQHNTGIFFNTGAALNYAYTFELNSRVKLSVGANLFGFVQKLADDRFQVDPNLPLPLPTETNDFILQMAPGVSLEIERLTLSLASENLLDYNFTAKEGNTAKSDKIFMSLLSYDFPVSLGAATNAFLRPSMYLRTIPGQSNQVGFYTLLNTDGYYGQVGYNNFYGYALGGGYTFFNRVTVGALMEIGTGASLQKETSFELMASYFLGSPDERHKMVGHDMDEKNPLEEIEEKQKEEKAEKEAIIAVKKQQKELEKEAAQQAKEEEALKKSEAQKEKSKKEQQQKFEKDVEEQKARAEAERTEQAHKMDSINKAKQAEAAALKKEQQRKIDSVAQTRTTAIQAVKKDKEAEVMEKEPEVQPEAGEKYEEVHTEDGLEPGFYLIANVFGTQKYFDAFVTDLKKKGIQPKFFLRSKNGYLYVYLQRYGTIREARTARDTNFGGKYTGNTWIFRVVSE
ncbi:MAG TPA: PorP/SprF family type IX secretion system membrane protein [Pricia sp.]|nr:PorP/SprF family type IX secretion system membrane protein [Pricia sp.]